jgi:hypothetical protein
MGQATKRENYMSQFSGKYAFVAAVAAVVLSACGTQTNPTEGYQDVKVAGGPHQQPTKTQYDAGYICVKPTIGDFTDDSSILNFQVGKTGQYVIKAQCPMMGVQFNLVAKGLPETATFNRSGANQYLLTWTPTKNVMSRSGGGSRAMSFTLEYQIVAYPKSDYDISFENRKTYTYQIAVQSELASPKINRISLAASSVIQGDKVAVTIEAEDPSAIDGAIPQLVYGNDQGGATDVNVVGAANAVTFDQGQLKAPGVFVYNGLLDSGKIRWPSAKAKNKAVNGEITARILVSVRGVDGQMSTVAQVNVEVAKKVVAAPATPTPTPTPKATPTPTPNPTPKPTPAPTPAPQGGKK